MTSPTDICHRFKDQRERNRWLMLMANMHEGEDALAYGLFTRLFRVKMGMMVFAPDQKSRYETSYRDSLKYHLQTIRHGRLATSFVPMKTRVYFVETEGVLANLYECADFCVAGGSLQGGSVDLLTPLSAGCPLAIGPAYRENPVAKALDACGGALLGADMDDLVAKLGGWVKEPEQAQAAALKASAWLGENRGMLP